MRRDFYFVEGLRNKSAAAHIGQVIIADGEVLVMYVLCGRLHSVRWVAGRTLQSKKELKKKVCVRCWKKYRTGDVDKLPVDKINWSPHSMF